MIIGTKTAAAAGLLLACAAVWTWARHVDDGLEVGASAALAPETARVDAIPLEPRTAAGAAEDEAGEVRPRAIESTEDGGARSAVARTLFRGRLVDAYSEEPLPDFGFRVTTPAGVTETVTTDAKGHFQTVSSFGPGHIRFSPFDHVDSGVFVPDEVVPTWDWRIRHPNPDVGDPTVRDLPVEAGPTYALAPFAADGRIVDLAGASAILRTYPWRWDHARAWTPLRGGANRWVRFPLVPPGIFGGMLALELRDGTGSWAGNIPVLGAGGRGKMIDRLRGVVVDEPVVPGVLAVELTERAILTGTARDTAGQPVAGQVISLRVTNEKAFEELASLHPMEHRATTDSEGRFRFAWVLPGDRYQLSAVVGEAYDFGTLLALVPGEQTRDLVIEPFDTRSTLCGRVVSGTGLFDAHTRVFVEPVTDGPGDRPWQKSLTVRWRETDEGLVGRFHFDALAAGEYRVTIRSEGMFPITPKRQVVELPGEEVVFEVDDELPSRVLELVASPEDPTLDLRYFDVRFILHPDSPEGWHYSAISADDDGVVRIAVPLDAPFEWRIHSHGWQPSWGDQDDFASTDRIERLLRPGWGLHFKVNGPDGAAAGARVYLDGELAGRTDESGVLRISWPTVPEVGRVEYVHGDLLLVDHIREDWRQRTWHTSRLRLPEDEDALREARAAARRAHEAGR